MQFRDIVGFEGTYAMASDGTVFRLTGNTGKPLVSPKPVKQHLRKDGYCLTHLSKNNEVQTFVSHRLVWETLNGPVPDGLEINHLNGIRSDNRPENLEACTRSQNLLHKYRTLGYRQPTGWQYKGIDHPNAMLTDDMVRDIRRRWKGGERQVDIAASIGIHQTTVSDICRRKRWAHVS